MKEASEEPTELRQEPTRWYFGSIPRHEFHYHHCVECGEDHGCYEDECYMADQYICHNCYDKILH